MRSRSAGVASMGTRSLSWRFTPQAPTSASSFTASTGGSGGRTSEPNGSRPRFATVQRPKENLCSGRGTYESALMIDEPLSKVADHCNQKGVAGAAEAEAYEGTAARLKPRPTRES